MTTLVNNTKTYAVVAAMKSAPHIQDQKATGRPKGVIVTGRSTTGVGAIKPTTDRSHQGTTGSSMGETKAQKTQLQDEAKAKLHKALYKIFDVKEPMTIEQKDPIEVKAICYSGGQYSSSLVTQPIKTSFTKYGGHKRVPPPDKLMRSKECFHCHKKGHYACNCQVKRQVNHDWKEVAEICSMQSRPDMGILPMDRLTKRIQENKSTNSFDALKEETLDQTSSAPAPKLLDAKRIKELIAAHKQKNVPMLSDIKKVQEFVKNNAHKFDEATRKEIIKLCKPKLKPTVKQLGDAHANPKSKPSAQQMGDALKEQIQTMDEDTKIRMLNELIPKNGFSIQKIEALAKTFRLDSVFVNKSNSVQIEFAVISYKQETKEIGLLDTGATENFIDSETVKKLRLGMKDLPYQRPVFNVDGTPNRQGKISHYCDLMVSQGNLRQQLRFFVTNLGRDHFLFGYPWFKAFKPDIDWEAGTLKGPKVKVETI